MNKREFVASSIASIVGLPGTAAMSSRSEAQTACVRTADPATFVLVHGAWCGGFVYDQVARSLRSKGHRVFAPSLTGLGDRTHLSNPDIDLTTHVNDVLSLMRFQELSDIVLVGHSYGGLVISGVAESEAEKIDSIVYLDAFLPGFFNSEDLGPLPENSNNTLPLPEEFSRTFGIPGEDRWKYSAHPIGTFLEVDRFNFSGAHNSISKKTYVLANQPPSFQVVFDSLTDDPSWITYSVESRHMLMLDVPDRVVEILEVAI